MTRMMVRAAAVFWVAGGLAMTVLAQQPAGTLKELNELLRSSCFGKPVLTLDASGVVLRTGRNGATQRFKLSEIGEIVSERPDAQAHIVLRCKDQKPCVEVVATPGGPTSRGGFTVFSITPRTPTGDRVLKLFTDLRAAAGASGR